jgi:hypothetical protein
VEILVGASPEVAFRTFTEEIGLGLRSGRSGWINPKRGRYIRLRRTMAGRSIEAYDARTDTGCEIGRVIHWEPGVRPGLTSAQPDWPEDESTPVDVRFEPLTDATLVSLEQRGFECVGPDAAELCAEYGSAWQEALRWLAARTRVTWRDTHRRKSVRLHGGLIRAVQAAGNAAMTPLTKILLSSALGVAAAAAVVAIHSTAADAIRGALALVSLIVVTRSAIQMAGDSGSPEGGGHLTDGSSRGPRFAPPLMATSAARPPREDPCG